MNEFLDSIFLYSHILAVAHTGIPASEDAERIKNLSTARTYKMEAKGKDRQEVEFFGKFVLCSNNETTPSSLIPKKPDTGCAKSTTWNQTTLTSLRRFRKRFRHSCTTFVIGHYPRRNQAECGPDRRISIPMRWIRSLPQAETGQRLIWLKC